MSWNKLTTREFIKRARRVHGDRYDYSRVNYINAKVNIIIGCSDHGWFVQRPDNHLYGKKGCSLCARGGTVAERFLRCVNKYGPHMPGMKDRCWQWAGHTRNKYGTLWVDGKGVKANRLAYELYREPIPSDKNNHYGTMLVCHKCDNPLCVNPNHLFLGTSKDNMQDMSRKGRQRDQSGEKNSMAVLTWKKVRSIRDLYATGNYLQRELAAMFGVSIMAINNIVNYKRWKDS
jgi:hypothetical protein